MDLLQSASGAPAHWLAVGAAALAWIAAGALRGGASRLGVTRSPREEASAFLGWTAPVWLCILAAAILAAAAGERTFPALWALWLASLLRRRGRVAAGLLGAADAFASSRLLFALALGVAALTTPAIWRRVIEWLPPQLVEQLPGAFKDFSKAMNLRPSDVPGPPDPSAPSWP